MSEIRLIIRLLSQSSCVQSIGHRFPSHPAWSSTPEEAEIGSDHGIQSAPTGLKTGLTLHSVCLALQTPPPPVHTLSSYSQLLWHGLPPLSVPHTRLPSVAEVSVPSLSVAVLLFHGFNDHLMSFCVCTHTRLSVLSLLFHR